MLYYDVRLSSGRVACQTCHPLESYGATNDVVSVGAGTGTRNAPSTYHAAGHFRQFWDGRADTLESQAKMLLTNMDEMGNRTLDDAVAKMTGVPEYVSGFRQVFGGPVTIDGFAKAVAAFERTLISGDSPFDRYLAGDLNAISEAARNGMILFRTKARCGVCHVFNQNFAAFATSPFFTDGNYRNTGVAANFGGFNALARQAMAATRDQSGKAIAAMANHERAAELGRFVTTGNTLDIGAFRTPSLRNVDLTAPYFHDGSAATLADVVRFYVNKCIYGTRLYYVIRRAVASKIDLHIIRSFIMIPFAKLRKCCQTILNKKPVTINSSVG